MRLLPSPSTSSPSTSTHFDANMCTSRSAAARRLAGILRGIICSRSLPTHPSDQITETSSIVRENNHGEHSYFNEKLEAPAATAPGIVARLMGLESLPDTSTGGRQVSVSSISRSLSMNSVEFRGECDQIQGKDRGIKGTWSFHEMPTFLELEDENFFILSFEKECKTKRVRSKGRKFEVDCAELKPRKREKCRSEENRRKKVALEKKEDTVIIKKMTSRVVDEEQLSKRISDNPILELGCSSKIEEQSNVSVEAVDKSHRTSHKEVFAGAKLRKQKKKANGCFALENEELECSSKDSSPVSVLDFGQLVIDPEVSSSEKNTNSGGSNSRRKLTPEFANHNYLSQHGCNYLIGDDQNSRKKVGYGQDHLSMWLEICWLSGAQVVKSNWNHKSVGEFKYFEDIIADIGSQILDELLQEMVDLLV